MQTLFDADRFEELAAQYQQRLRAQPRDLAAINGLIQVYSRWNRLDDALAYYQRREALEPGDPEAHYAVGVFIWNQLYQKGGGAEMAAFDPRPGGGDLAGRQKKTGKNGVNPQKVPPPPGLADITGEARVRLADIGIRSLQQALSLRPRYPEALTYLNLLNRQKSYAYFSQPDKWQECIDAAERWRHQAESLGRSP